jgi:hypothetical protein
MQYLLPSRHPTSKGNMAGHEYIVTNYNIGILIHKF